MSLNVKAPTFDAAQTAEHRKVFPDRKCEAEGPGCKGPVLAGLAGDRQLCGQHYWLFDEADCESRGARLEAWVSAQRRQKGAA